MKEYDVTFYATYRFHQTVRVNIFKPSTEDEIVKAAFEILNPDGFSRKFASARSNVKEVRKK